MKFDAYIRTAFYFIYLTGVESDVIQNGFLKLSVDNTESEWSNITGFIGRILAKSQRMEENGKLHVTIFLLNHPTWNRVYEGFQAALTNVSTDKILITSFSFPKLRQKLKADFVIILTTPRKLNYLNFVKNILRIMFISKHTRFIIIVRSSIIRFQIITSFWTQMSSHGYLNVYIVLETSDGTFSIYRTEGKNKNNITLSQINQFDKNNKQIVTKDSQIYSEIPIFTVITYDSYPTTFVQNNKIYGIDGYFINEFSKWINTTYNIVDSWKSKPEISILISKMQNNVDICLCADFSIYDTSVESVTLFETNGLCLLVPRNIYVSSYENLSLPMDRLTLFLSVISAISLVICWKLISRHSEHRLTTSEMFLSVLQLSFYTGAPNLIRLNVKEKLLIFSFIFGSFFMSNLYESSILSFMMAEPTVRSAKDLEELNNSNTKFFSFYDDSTAFLSKMPTLKRDLIMNQIDFKSSYSLELPDNFDENLVYLVTCRYAENFQKSSKNYHNNHQLFDVRLLRHDYQSYTLRNGFPFYDEFSKFVSTTLEAGIRIYWTKMAFSDRHKYINNEAAKVEKHFIEFQDMLLPMIVIIVGSLLALFVFILENLKYHGKCKSMNKISPVPQMHQIFKQKSNLRKWRIKFLKNISERLKKKDDIKSKSEIVQFLINFKRTSNKQAKFPVEDLKCGYWTSRKLKHKTKFPIIMVTPVSTAIDIYQHDLINQK